MAIKRKGAFPNFHNGFQALLFGNHDKKLRNKNVGLKVRRQSYKNELNLQKSKLALNFSLMRRLNLDHKSVTNQN